MEFSEAKNQLLEAAKKQGACIAEYQRAYRSETSAQLLEVIKNNIGWLTSNKVADAQKLEEWFGEETLKENNIFIRGHHVTNSVWAVASGNATVRAFGNATVRAFGNATVRALENATVRAFGNATVRAFENATVEASGNATVRAFGNATVRALENATVEASGNALCHDYNNNCKELSGRAIRRDYIKNVIEIKKSDFEIVIVE